MLNSTGVLFGDIPINSHKNKLLCKKQMAFIDFLGNPQTYGGQMEESIIIHSQKTAAFQNAHRMTDTRFAKAHVPGKVNGADHALLLLKNQHSLQIILPGRMNLHRFLLVCKMDIFQRNIKVLQITFFLWPDKLRLV